MTRRCPQPRSILAPTSHRAAAHALLVVGLALSGAASAQDAPAGENPDGPVIGDIEGATFRALPLALPNFRAQDPRGDARRPAAGLTAIVRNDLKMCGLFNILNAKSYIDTDGIEPGTVKFDDWLNVGAEGVVKAILTGDAKNFSVSVYAYNVASKSTLLEKKYAGTQKTLRTVAHRISDDVYTAYTGAPGVFSTRIAVVKKTGGQKHIFTIDMDGNRALQLTKSGKLNLLPEYAPDGQSVIYTSYRYDNPDLFSIPAGGGTARRISNRNGLNTGGRFSPDGQTIALTLSKDGNSEIYLITPAGKLIRRLTKSWGIDTSPDFSPDGKSVVFVSSRAGNPHLYLVPATGGKARRLTFQGKYNQTPSYDPKGRMIAFTARDEFNRFDIFVYDLEEKKISRVTQDQGNNENPTFAPNGSLIAFVSDRSGTKQIWVTTVDGRVQTRITATGRHSSPSWGPFAR